MMNDREGEKKDREGRMRTGRGKRGGKTITTGRRGEKMRVFRQEEFGLI